MLMKTNDDKNDKTHVGPSALARLVCFFVVGVLVLGQARCALVHWLSWAVGRTLVSVPSASLSAWKMEDTAVALRYRLEQ